MTVDISNNTKFFDMFLTSTFTWCFLIPLIHVFGLMSNILCIIVFCSNTFIKKPIAIYFIGLLISDSITLLIGYLEMTDRASSMVDKSSLMCVFNEKILLRLIDFVYGFMERFCIEWMFYKLPWTRASTILLAILSVQRTRTFFSLSYRETRLCAFIACICSVIIALTITCIEWTVVSYKKNDGNNIYSEIFQVILHQNSSKDLYAKFFDRNYTASMRTYRCLIESFNATASTNMANEFNCTASNISTQFESVTRLLLSDHDGEITEATKNTLLSIANVHGNSTNHSILIDARRQAKVPDFILKLFEHSTCYLSIDYSLWLRTYNFLNTVILTPSRRTLAIFLGNALPSFIVVSANLLSIKVIYFSKSLKYLKQTTRKNHRKRRLQNDLRAFLVIIIESFKIIIVAWGIPILLTMYHCHTLYVISVPSCPKIKNYLILFLCLDLFNSASNCLLYSLSGKLFRRRLICIIKTILVCGHGTFWHVKQRSLLLQNQRLGRQLSNNPSTNTNNNNNNFGIQSSRPGSYRQSERLSSPIVIHQHRKLSNSTRTTTTITYNRVNGHHRNISDDGSYSICKTSDDHHGGKNSSSEIESDNTRKANEPEPRKSSQSIGSFLLDKVRSLGSTSSASSKATSVTRPGTTLTVEKPKLKPKKKFLNSVIAKRQATADFSFSSSTGSVSHDSQRKYSLNNCYSLSKVLSNNTTDNTLITKDNIRKI